jgi:hypothetical protein
VIFLNQLYKNIILAHFFAVQFSNVNIEVSYQSSICNKINGFSSMYLYYISRVSSIYFTFNMMIMNSYYTLINDKYTKIVVSIDHFYFDIMSLIILKI